MSKQDSTSGISKFLYAVFTGKKNAVGDKQEVRPNLCFVNTTQGWGGGERWHYENACYASQSGFEVALVIAPGSELRKKALFNHFVSRKFINLSNLSFLNPVKLYKLYRFFRNEAIEVVIFNGPADLKTAGIAARWAGVPVRIYRRGLAKKPSGGFLNRFLFNRVITDFIVNSKTTASLLFSDDTISQEDARVHLLYNGVHPHEDQPPKSQNTVPVLGNASRFVEQKGLHYLLEMASVLKQQGEKFIVRIAGFGPLEHGLKTKSKALGLENIVEFPGFVKDVPGFVNGLDVYVCSSEFEGFGFAIAEAMHAAKPVTGFRVSSNPELVLNGETGFLVPPFDVKALAEKTRELMHDANKRKRMGMAGKNRAMQMFHKEKQHQQFCALMQELSRKTDD